MSDISSAQELSPQSIPPPEQTGQQASNSPSVTPSTRISSLEDLKRLAPPLYDAIMMSIAMEIKRQQEAANAEMKRILREAQANQR